MRALLRWSWGLGLLAAFLAPERARADETLVVVLGADAALVAALETALSPWGIAVREGEGATPGAVMPDAARAAAEVGERSGAAVVVWIASSDEGHALFVFDVASGRVVARQSPRAPPLDDVSAASLALSVKTLLRHTVASPPAERFGAEAAPRPIVAPTPAPAPRPSVVRVATLGGVRLFRDGDPSPELRMGLGLGFWPDALGQRLGIGLEAVAGPGFGVRRRGLVARYVEAQLSLVVTARALVVGAFALSVVGRLDAVFAFLDGSFAATDDDVSVFRLDPQGALLLQADYELGGARIGLRVGGTGLVLRQRYLVDGRPVLTLPPFGLEAAVFIDFGL
jgi:hypothetical protein